MDIESSFICQTRTQSKRFRRALVELIRKNGTSEQIKELATQHKIKNLVVNGVSY